MILHAVFSYRASVVAPRKRLSEELYFEDVHSIEIREVSSLEAPVAFRVTDQASAPAKTIRSFEDILWLRRPLGSDGTSDVEVLKRARDQKLNIARETSTPINCDDTGIRRPDPARIGSWLQDNKDAQRRELDMFASSLVLVDGELFRKTKEPYFVIRHGPNSYVSVSFDQTHDDWPFCFRADEAGLLRKLAVREDIRFPSYAAIDVDLPGAVRLPLIERAVHASAKLLAGSMADRLAEMDEAYFSSFKRIRDVLKTLPESRFLTVDHDIKPLIDCLPDAIEQHLRTGSAHLGLPYSAELAQSSLARWDARQWGDALSLAP